MSRENSGDVRPGSFWHTNKCNHTMESVFNFNELVSSQKFKDKEAETIFDYLLNSMETREVHKFLRSYLYEKEQIEKPFQEVTDKEFRAIIRKCFKENQAPCSFTESATPLSKQASTWLTRKTVQRETIFVLGFGLKMNDEEVSEFMVKVCKQRDFDYTDPEEVIYWYCFHQGLSYSDARAYLDYYEEIEVQEAADYPEYASGIFKGDFSDEDEFKDYLRYLKQNRPSSKEQTFKVYKELRGRAEIILADFLEKTGSAKGKIKDADFVRMFCSGIPKQEEEGSEESKSKPQETEEESEESKSRPQETEEEENKKEDNNLYPTSDSLLADVFDTKRMDTQRLSKLKRGKIKIDRFDLLSFLFLIYALSEEEETPDERYIRFMDEGNELLARCNIKGIYPDIPYECFLLMCLLTEEPLAVYNEVWELSYAHLRA